MEILEDIKFRIPALLGDSIEMLLRVRANLSTRSCTNVLFYFLPILTELSHTLYEAFMLFFSPAS